MSSISGVAPCAGAARGTGRPGATWTGWPRASCPDPGSPTPGPSNASASNTQGGSRMRESRPYGSVRGARSNARPYRDRPVRRKGRIPSDRLPDAGAHRAAVQQQPHRADRRPVDRAADHPEPDVPAVEGRALILPQSIRGMLPAGDAPGMHTPDFRTWFGRGTLQPAEPAAQAEAIALPEAPAPAAPAALWSSERMGVVDSLWGDGYVFPGGE